MKIVVVGGTGLIGSKTIALLRAAGHEAVAAAPATGVNTITGDGLAEALEGADVVVDLVNSPSFEPSAVMEFFKTHETNLTAAERRAGVPHHVALSIVGTDRMPDNGYFAAKLAQEELIRSSGVPYTIVRSTQFLEFLGAIAGGSDVDGSVHIATGLFQPIAADDVARLLADTIVDVPRNGIIEIAGPRRAPFDEIIRDYLRLKGDPRPVSADPEARYFGGKVEEFSLVPMGGARLGAIGLTEWLAARPS